MSLAPSRRSRRRTTTGLAAAGLAGLTLLTTPTGAAAQDGGRTLRFSLDQSVRVTDNPGFVPNPDAGGVIARTGLGANLDFVGRSQRLGVDAGSFLEYGDNADDGFQSPTVGARYQRTGPTSRLDLDARWRETDVRSTFALPFADPPAGIEDDPVEDPDGEAPPVGDDDAVIDDDITIDEQDLITDDGTRREIRAGAGLALGLGTPAELRFGVDYRRRDFLGTNDPALFDNERLSARAGAELLFNPAVVGLIDARVDRLDADNVEQTERTTTSLGAGARLRANAALDLEGQLFYDRAELSETTGDSTEEGIGARLAFTLARPLGDVRGEFRSQITANGRRDALRFGRTLALRDGTLAGDVGLIRFDDGEVRPVASLNFRRDLRDGAVSARLDQTAGIDDDDNDVIRTGLTVRMTRDINSVSSLNGQATLAAVSVVGGEDALRAGLSAGYTRALTRDWGLTTGYQLTIGNSDDEDRTSNTLFVTLGRDFTFRF